MCEQCMHFLYDQELEEETCAIAFMMDEDDFSRMNYSEYKKCPYFKIGDEYTLIRKQQ